MNGSTTTYVISGLKDYILPVELTDCWFKSSTEINFFVLCLFHCFFVVVRQTSVGNKRNARVIMLYQKYVISFI